MALVGFTIILGAVAMLNVGRIDIAVQSIVVDFLPGEASIGRLDSPMKEQRAVALTHMLVETPEQKSQADSDMANAMRKFQAEAKACEKNDHDSPRPRVVPEVAPPIAQFNRAWAKIQSLSQASKQREAIGWWKALRLRWRPVKASPRKQRG
jgi:hypothetical protein